jgi:hypothetical protein
MLLEVKVIFFHRPVNGPSENQSHGLGLRLGAPDIAVGVFEAAGQKGVELGIADVQFHVHIPSRGCFDQFQHAWSPFRNEKGDEGIPHRLCGWKLFCSLSGVAHSLQMVDKA